MLNDRGRLIGAKGKLSSRMAKCKFAQCAKKRKQNPAAAATVLLLFWDKDKLSGPINNISLSLFKDCCRKEKKIGSRIIKKSEILLDPYD